MTSEAIVQAVRQLSIPNAAVGWYSDQAQKFMDEYRRQNVADNGVARCVIHLKQLEWPMQRLLQSQWARTTELNEVMVQEVPFEPRVYRKTKYSFDWKDRVQSGQSKLLFYPDRLFENVVQVRLVYFEASLPREAITLDAKMRLKMDDVDLCFGVKRVDGLTQSTGEIDVDTWNSFSPAQFEMYDPYVRVEPVPRIYDGVTADLTNGMAAMRLTRVTSTAVSVPLGCYMLDWTAPTPEDTFFVDMIHAGNVDLHRWYVCQSDVDSAIVVGPYYNVPTAVSQDVSMQHLCYAGAGFTFDAGAGQTMCMIYGVKLLAGETMVLLDVDEVGSEIAQPGYVAWLQQMQAGVNVVSVTHVDAVQQQVVLQCAPYAGAQNWLVPMRFVVKNICVSVAFVAGFTRITVNSLSARYVVDDLVQLDTFTESGGEILKSGYTAWRQSMLNGTARVVSVTQNATQTIIDLNVASYTSASNRTTSIQIKNIVSPRTLQLACATMFDAQWTMAADQSAHQAWVEPHWNVDSRYHIVQLGFNANPFLPGNFIEVGVVKNREPSNNSLQAAFLEEIKCVEVLQSTATALTFLTLSPMVTHTTQASEFMVRDLYHVAQYVVADDEATTFEFNYPHGYQTGDRVQIVADQLSGYGTAQWRDYICGSPACTVLDEYHVRYIHAGIVVQIGRVQVDARFQALDQSSVWRVTLEFTHVV